MSRRWVATVATLITAGGLVQAEASAQVANPGSYVDVRSATAVDRPSTRGGTLAVIRHRMGRLERQVRGYQRIMTRMDRWFGCIDHVRVDQVGDVEHQWGFHYDERDGTGLDTRTALVRHVGSGRPDLLMLRLSRTRGCLSRTPDPNGTGEDARGAPPPSSAGADRPGHRRAASRERALRRDVRRLERRLHRLEKRVDRVESDTERFDEWESCLSWLPVTEYGHEDQDLGYLVDDVDAEAPAEQPDRYLPALDIDTSEWDDPDYEVLAFLGRDRPFGRGECGHEPGEGVDRQAAKARTPTGHRRTSTRAGSYAERLSDLRRDVRGTAEDLGDLLEPVQEFVQFDECMFTVGVQDRAGYRYRTAAGTDTHRSALSFDMTGLQLPDFDVMAFPGEEPPQIECNEDAGGENTDE